MGFFTGNEFDVDVNELHRKPGQYTKPGAVDLFHTSKGEMESRQVPENYRITRANNRLEREKNNISQHKALTYNKNTARNLGPEGSLTRAARHYEIIEPDQALIDQFADEISLDSKATKTGALQEGVDALQTGMYAVSGGLLNMMKTGDVVDSFKQSLSEIRHTFDDDYTADPNSWFSREVYRAEWGQILRANDAIIGRKLLNVVSPFVSDMRDSYDDSGNWLGDISDLFNVVWDKEFRDEEVLKNRQRIGTRNPKTGKINVSLTNAENNAIAMLGFGLDIALDPTTYFGYGILKSTRLLRGADTILKGTETTLEATARATRSYNKALKSDPQSRLAIRRANLKEELQAKAIDPSNTRIIEEDIEKGLREFDKVEAEKIASEEAQRLTKIGKVGKALGGEVRPEGYSLDDVGLGSIPTAVNFALASTGNSWVGRKIGEKFIVDNAVKRLQNPKTAKTVAQFLKDNAEEIATSQPNNEKSKALLDHIANTEVDVLAGEVVQDSAEYLKLVKDVALEGASETQRIKNGMLQLNKTYGLDARYAMTLFASKPAIARQIIEAGDYDAGIKEELYKVLDVAKDLMQEVAEKDMRHGVLDETLLRADYVPARAPLTKAGERSMEAFLLGQDLGEDRVKIIMKDLTDNKIGQQSLQARLSNGATATFQNKATFEDVYGRLVNVIPTEMDFTLLYGNRNFESLRLRNTKKFADHILGDTRLTIPVDASIAEKSANSSPLRQKFIDNGFDFYSPAGDWKGEGKAFYAMPKDMVKALNESNTLLNETASGKAWNIVKESPYWKSYLTATTLWRQWALGSVGYVSRNIQSNVFTNYVAGVKNPARYLEAAMLQWGGTENMPRGLRSYVESKTGGSKYLENYKFELKDGRVLSLKEMRAEMDRTGLFADNFTTDEMVELAGVESATYGIYKNRGALSLDSKGRSVIGKGLDDNDMLLPEWGSTEVRVEEQTKKIKQVFAEAKGEPISDDDAAALAELYDGMARQWAWNNNTDGKLGVTPRDWWNKLTIEGFSDVNQAKSKIVEQSLYQKMPDLDASEKNLWSPWWDEEPETLPTLRSVMGRLVEENAQIKGKSNIWRKADGDDLVLTFAELKAKVGPVLTGKNSPLSKQQRQSVATRVDKEKAASANLPVDAEAYRRDPMEGNAFANVDDWIEFNAKHRPDVTITKDQFVEALNRGLFRMEAVTQKRGMTPENIQRKIGTHNELEASLVEDSVNASGNINRGSFDLEEQYKDAAREEWPFNRMTLPLMGRHEARKILRETGGTYKTPPRNLERMPPEVRLGVEQDLRGLDFTEPFEATHLDVYPDTNYRVGYITVNGPLDDLRPYEWQSTQTRGGVGEGDTNLARQWSREAYDQPSGRSGRQAEQHDLVNRRAIERGDSNLDAELIEANESRMAHYRVSDYIDEKSGDKYLVLNELQSDFFNPTHNARFAQRKSTIDWIKKHHQHWKDQLAGRFVYGKKYPPDTPLPTFSEYMKGMYGKYGFGSLPDNPSNYYIRKMTDDFNVDQSVINDFEQLVIDAPEANLTDADLEKWVLDSIDVAYEAKVRARFAQEDSGKRLDEIVEQALEFLPSERMQKLFDYDPMSGYGPSLSAQQGKKLYNDLLKTALPATQNDWMTPALKLLIQDASRGGYKKLIWAGEHKQVSHAEQWGGLSEVASVNKMQKAVSKNYTDTKHKGSVGDRINKVLTDINAEADGGGKLAVGTFKDAEYNTGTYNALDISDDLRSKSLNGGMTLFQKDSTAQNTKIKGMISFFEQGRKTITAFKGADVSTMVHELAHLARRGGMLEDGDLDVINNWVFGRDVKGGRIDKEINKFQKEGVGDTGEMAWSDDDRRAFVDEIMWSNPNPLDGEKLNAEEKFAVAVEKYILEDGLKPTGFSSNHIKALDRLQEAMGQVYKDNPMISKLIPEELPLDVRQKINKVLGQRVEAEPEKAKLLKSVVGIGEAEEAKAQSIGGRVGQALLGLEGESLGTRKGWKNALGNNAWLRATRGAARITEQNARGALFIQSMMDGMTGTEAATNVKKYLFDYSELTDFEKDVMRNVIPFYTWMRKNVPLQMESILRNPAKYANVAKAHSEFGGLSESVFGDDPPTPDYFTEQLAVRFPVNLGNQPTYLIPDLPYMDFETAQGFLDEDKWISMAHPFIRLGLEQWKNKKSFTGAMIDDPNKAGEPVDLFGVDVSSVYSPRVEYALEGLFPILSRASSTAKRNEEGKTAKEYWSQFLGVNLKSVDVDKVLRARTFAVKTGLSKVTTDFKNRIEGRMEMQRKLKGLVD